ncbi:hypothetical protein TKK_0017233 [Trichogramma kaykai]|uniref:chymotrypsin n=1 Tax=Trichogramma kaykai TaxID=54128 RepID=A0ABD2W5L7_9HYME
MAMYAILFLWVLLFYFADAGVLKTRRGSREVSGRIVNGTEADMGQFPFLVSLRRTNERHFCSGTIIAKKWILTAAHCMKDPQSPFGDNLAPSAIVVVAGEIVLKNSNRSNQKNKVVKIVVHPEFSDETYANDIALLELEHSFMLKSVLVHKLTINREFVEPGTACRVAGWGYTNFTEKKLSPILLYVDVPLMNRSKCQELMFSESTLPQGLMCAGYLEGGRDACEGDSGGGLVCNGALSGIVSAGYECASPNLPGMYTDVKHFLPWIAKYVDEIPLLQEDDLNKETVHLGLVYRLYKIVRDAFFLIDGLLYLLTS